MKLKFILLLLLCSLPGISNAIATPVFDQELTTFSGENITIDHNKISHLVFIDLWGSYQGNGDEELIAGLPSEFLNASQQVWIQPALNVTLAQLAEFQQYYPQVTPLVLDHSYQIMRSFEVWQAPYHVLIKDRVELFSGSIQDLKRYLNGETNNSQQPQPEVASSSPASSVSKVKQSTKPLVGDPTPKRFAAISTLDKAQVLSVIFLDSLCPMPHFPNCEAKIAQLNQLVSAEPERQWLGVVNSFYVNPEVMAQFSDKFSLKLPLIFDRGNKIFKAFGVHATPYQIDINGAGIIEYRSEQLH